MCIVQDNKVQRSIASMANKLLKLSWKEIEDSWKDGSRPSIEADSIGLSYVLRDSIASSMDVKLPSVTDQWREWNK